MSSLPTCGRPIWRPLALVLAIPDRTRERIIANSNWLSHLEKCFAHRVSLTALTGKGDLLDRLAVPDPFRYLPGWSRH